MKDVTSLVIKQYKLYELGYDFMGYPLEEGDKFTVHHLIIPSRLNGPLERWNMSILCGLTAHTYLHLIESLDYYTFLKITSELIDINVQGYIDITNLERIDSILTDFEQEWIIKDVRNGRGKRKIKEKYTQRILNDNNLKEIYLHK